MKNKIDTIFDTDFYNGLNNHKKLFQILIFFIIYIWLIYYIYSLFSFYQYFTSYSQYTGYIKSCDKNEIEEINNLKPILLKHNTTEKYTYIITIIIFVILVLIYSYILFDKKDDLNIHDNIQHLQQYIDNNESYYNLIISIYMIFLLLKISYVDENILNKNHDMSFNIVFNFLIGWLLLSLKFKKDYSYYIFILIIFSIIINFIYNYISYNEDPDTKNFTNKKKINLDIIMNLLLYFFGIIISIYLLLRNENRYHYSNLIKTFIHLFILIFIITFFFIIHYYSKFNNTLYNYDGFFGIKTHHRNDDINDRNFIDDFTTTFYVLFIVSTIIILIKIKDCRYIISEFDHIPNILTMFLIFTILLFITGGLYKGYKYHTDFTQDSYNYKSELYNINTILYKNNIEYLKWEQITNTHGLNEYSNDEKKNLLITLLKFNREYAVAAAKINPELEKAEWEELKITDFTPIDYINVEGKYFKPVEILPYPSKWEQIIGPKDPLTEYSNDVKKQLLIDLLESKINPELKEEEWKDLKITDTDFAISNYVKIEDIYFKPVEIEPWPSKWKQIISPKDLSKENQYDHILLIELLKSKINIDIILSKEEGVTLELEPATWEELEITDFTPIDYINVEGKYFKLKNTDFDNIIKNYKQINNDFEELNFIIIRLFKFEEGQETTYYNFILIDNNNTFHNKQFNSFNDKFDEIFNLPETQEDEKEKKKDTGNKYNNDVKNYIINNISTKYYPISYRNNPLKEDEDTKKHYIKQNEEQIYNKITNLFTFIIITTLIISIIMYSYLKEYSYYYNINNLILILITISIIIIIITDIYLKNI